MTHQQTGYATSGDARIYFEIAGSGDTMVMIHAGVADRRQWNAAFDHFQDRYTVLRYDMRGYGRSEPAPGKFRPIDDLHAVLAAAGVEGPTIMMGCSMGGTLAMDFTIANQEAVRALVMVCSGPSGLSLDIAQPDKFALVEAAERDNDLDRVCELATQIWFDGVGRKPSEVDQDARALLYQMNRLALDHASRDLGTREYDLTPAAFKRMDEISVPVMVLTGGLDIPFMAAAADIMQRDIANVRRVGFADAAHLPNMEHPDRFNEAVEAFLRELPR